MATLQFFSRKNENCKIKQSSRPILVRGLRLHLKILHPIYPGLCSSVERVMDNCAKGQRFKPQVSPNFLKIIFHLNDEMNQTRRTQVIPRSLADGTDKNFNNRTFLRAVNSAMSDQINVTYDGKVSLGKMSQCPKFPFLFRSRNFDYFQVAG